MITSMACPWPGQSASLSAHWVLAPTVASRPCSSPATTRRLGFSFGRRGPVRRLQRSQWRAHDQVQPCRRTHGLCSIALVLSLTKICSNPKLSPRGTNFNAPSWQERLSGAARMLAASGVARMLLARGLDWRVSEMSKNIIEIPCCCSQCCKIMW